MEKINVVPFSSGFMVTSIVGFIVSMFYVYPRSMPLGFTLVLFFMIMFVASMISMTYAPGEWPFKSDNIKIKK